MFGRKLHVWQRLQETPLELSFAWFLAIAAVLNLTEKWGTLSPTAIALLITIVLGGVTTTAARLVPDLDGESAGLCLFIAAMSWLLIYNFFSEPINGQAIAGLLVSFGAFVFGFVIRLYVVRKAARVLRRHRSSGRL